ncbi:nitrilase-related carbon-nitrogen hydrolase [Bradyrhizobium sp. CCGUVB23]|uniref:nitrilase-related carbon-nitrogen hydrolase n=1 Tax=Bradyrhizobium sp. CCGUVB23 TaxID=2949630 RepID=UPI0020B2A86A|nr:nitrilase-related carbon-nitrogen hydrolase [Bradyrhizobium sp. CCGUVB23]MCP3468390.1 hypothetical protein [Bradyrhizobium sp. CCGUVB23]
MFPGWGWWDWARPAILFTMTTRKWPIAAIVGASFWAWSAAHWIAPSQPDGWVGLDTKLGSVLGRAPNLDQSQALLQRVREAAAAGARVVVFPENAAGLWTPTASGFWVDGLRGNDVTLIVGAAIVNREGYDNAMMEISAGRARRLYGERMPVPVSMWQPWLAWTGQGGGARASGGLAVTQLVESKGAVMMKDGIPSGIATSGRVLVKFASGSLTALSGKALNFSSKSTGPNRFDLEFTE